jgi:hypothetical protein
MLHSLIFYIQNLLYIYTTKSELKIYPIQMSNITVSIILYYIN